MISGAGLLFAVTLPAVDCIIFRIIKEEQRLDLLVPGKAEARMPVTSNELGNRAAGTTFNTGVDVNPFPPSSTRVPV